MCGVVGVCGRAAFGKGDRVGALLTSMAHRGPDDSGTWRGNLAVLGHCRLKIMDLSEDSRQPAMSADGGRVLLYNGEVYNYADIVTAPCASDTLALSVQAPSVDPARLRGMFALAVWDVAAHRLELTRDRFGIKPLYVSARNGDIAFASYACSTAVAAGDAVLDRRSIASFLRFGSVQGPRTMFDEVQEVEPGTTLTWQSGTVVTRRYWEYPTAPVRRSRAEVEQALRETVQAHVLSDVPVAVFLSAGVDSTLIAALAAEAGLDVHAITIAMPGHGSDEAVEAATTTKALGLSHVVVDVSHDEIDFDSFFAAMDQPSIDGLNTYLVAGAASQAGFRVALTGLGADEIFAGYSLFRRIPAMAAAAHVLPAAARGALLRRWGNAEKIQELVEAGSNVEGLHDVLRSLWSAADVVALTGQRANTEVRDLGPGSMDSITRLELASYTCNTLLRDADVYGMAHSVEIRTPYLDHQVLEAALGYSQFARALPAKRLLKDMLRGRGLDHVVQRRKTGFGLPYDDWLGGPLAERVTGLTSGPLTEVLTGAGARDVLREARRAPTMQLWSLVVLDAWLRRQLDRDGRLKLSELA